MKKSAASIPLVGLFITTALAAYDYVYPVGVFQRDENTSVLVMYQKSPQYTELWQWDLESGEAQHALLSTFTPIGVAMLPNNAGFSFFDNGRLRVKLWHKRSSKAIDIFEPLYDLGPIQWKTEHICYFHARERELFNVYKLDASDGSIEKVIYHETSDCFYPFIKDQTIWYLQRSQKMSQLMVHREGQDLVLYTHDKPLAFLSYNSDKEFLVIEHPRDVDLYYNKVFPCTCCRLSNLQGIWRIEKLFPFTIPLHLITPTSPTHLCESMYPLLPRMVGSKIFFVTTNESGRICPCVYAYEQGTRLLEFTTNGILSDFFTPFVIHDNLICGGAISGVDLRGGPWIDEEQSVFLQLPLVSL